MTRVLAVAALVVATVAVAVLLLRNGDDYTLHVRFVDAGQLVKGNLVEVGGRRIGSVSDIRLTNDNQADVVLKINDDEFVPFRQGTKATIRQVGLSGVANRFVELTPGSPTAPAIRDGGVLGTNDTKPIVDLDQVLNALDPATRGRLQKIIRLSDRTLEGQTKSANAALAYLNPALSQTASLAEELGRDEIALGSLIRSTATVSGALASREGDLEAGVASTATALRAVASERTALEDILARAPSVMTRAQPSLRRLRRTLQVLRPTLDDARPAARPLARVLRVLPSAARNSTPVVRELRLLLPSLRRTLELLGPLARQLVPEIRDTTTAARAFLPILAGLRPYAPDLVAGLYNGFGGVTGGYYDANGHYARIAAEIGGASLTGLGSLFPTAGFPNLDGLRTGLDARCPGSGSEPHPDGSNPWVPDPSLCDPADSRK